MDILLAVIAYTLYTHLYVSVMRRFVSRGMKPFGAVFKDSTFSIIIVAIVTVLLLPASILVATVVTLPACYLMIRHSMWLRKERLHAEKIQAAVDARDAQLNKDALTPTAILMDGILRP